jgi:predicted DNA-binding protein with PD1-like motif
VADSQGRVSGGHLAMGATVRTTAEVLMALLPACSFRRELDPSTGFRELIIRDQA